MSRTIILYIFVAIARLSILANSRMLKLTYFGFPGRAYAIRTALRIGGVAFEDEIIDFNYLNANKPSSPTIPLGSVPVLTLPSGKVISQSTAIARYAGKLSGLYPVDFVEALEVDEIMDTYQDVLVSAPRNSDAELLKIQRESWASDKLKIIMGYINEKVTNANGKFLVGGRLTLADLYAYALIKAILNGSYDHVPKDYCSAWPNLEKFVTMMESDAKFSPYKL